MNREIRTLRANEIDVRVAQVNKNGAFLLLYKNARTDMDILDEVYGPGYWQREHQVIGDRLYCTIKIWNKDIKQWVVKQDVGVESYTEKEKGQASDSFKRAGFNVGIGRELYTAPKIKINEQHIAIKLNEKGKYVTYDTFKVNEIKYNENREVSKLVIVNQNNKIVYTYDEKKSVEQEKKAKENNQVTENDKPITQDTIKRITLLAECYAQEVRDMTTDQILEFTKQRFNFNKFESLTNSQGLIVLNQLNNWINLQKKKKTA